VGGYFGLKIGRIKDMMGKEVVNAICREEKNKQKNIKK
jgi:hypothetical protein